jgi:hypothetical protein
LRRVSFDRCFATSKSGSFDASLEAGIRNFFNVSLFGSHGAIGSRLSTRGTWRTFRRATATRVPPYLLADHFGKPPAVFETFPKVRGFIAPSDGQRKREIK